MIPYSSICEQRMRPEMVAVAPGLYLGNHKAALDRKRIADKNIGHVVTLMHDSETDRPALLLVRQLIANMADRPSEYRITDHAASVCQFVIDAHCHVNASNVLVHCYAGISRSVSMTVLLLMLMRPMRMSEAVRYVWSRRQIAFPEPEFLRQVDEWLKSEEADVWRPLLAVSDTEWAAFEAQHRIKRVGRASDRLEQMLASLGFA